MNRNTINTISDELERQNGLKFEMNLAAELEKPTLSLTEIFEHDDAEPDIITRISYFHSGKIPVINMGDIEGVIAQATPKIMENLEKFTNMGSGRTLKRCVALDLPLSRYQPFRARSYFKTPKYIPPRTVVNVKNEDNRCFERSILSALYPVGHGKHPDRPSSYQEHLGKLNFAGIEFPVKDSDISKFEQIRASKHRSISMSIRLE